MDTNILTSNGIDINKGLELLGDIEMYNDTLKDFLQESETRIPQIQEALAKGDMENYGILTHAMKSDSKYLGFTQLAEMSYQHELAGKGNDLAFAQANNPALMAEANRIITVVKQYLGM